MDVLYGGSRGVLSPTFTSHSTHIHVRNTTTPAHGQTHARTKYDGDDDGRSRLVSVSQSDAAGRDDRDVGGRSGGQDHHHRHPSSPRSRCASLQKTNGAGPEQQPSWARGGEAKP